MSMSLLTHPTAPMPECTPSPRPPPPSWPMPSARLAPVARQRTAWSGAVPPALRPLLRAYLLGYASTVAPRLLTVLLAYFAARRRRRQHPDQDQDQDQPADEGKASLAHLSQSMRRILRSSLGWRRFPMFCAVLAGGSTLLEAPFRRLLARAAPGWSGLARVRLARWTASFLAGCASLRLLQTKPAEPAGRTLDLTLFAATRALDVLVGALWARHKTRRAASGAWTRLEALVGSATDPALFSLSSALVMWAWFYLPERLPHAYNRWITSAASIDERLIEALRRCRAGQLVYGADEGPDGRLLQHMCADYGWPPAWGDPQLTVPFPCDMVHQDCGPSCERHALVRLVRSWRWALATYLPLSLLLVLRPAHRSARSLLRAVLSAARSSAFLGAFIALFYYGVCLMRTRLGPSLLIPLLGAQAARQAIDGGLCTAAGCALCGWSILLERASRRKDIYLFVAPRALATLLPRRYPREKQWRETLVFAASTAVVFTAVHENPRRVRGVLGGLLKTVMVP